ncbi:type II toxin-antitoxin system VapC family toxin [Lacunimicrobium album]
MRAIEKLKATGFQLVIVPQCLYEFYVVATRPLSVNGMEVPPDEMHKYFAKIRAIAEFVPDTSVIYDHWERLVFTHRICGKPAHDARLVAAMKTHNITHMLTFNVSDFTKFGSEITVVDPVSQVA